MNLFNRRISQLCCIHCLTSFGLNLKYVQPTYHDPLQGTSTLPAAVSTYMTFDSCLLSVTAVVNNYIFENMTLHNTAVLDFYA